MTSPSAIEDAYTIVANVEHGIAGYPPGVQGAALALLLAKWLAGHVGVNRDALLAEHIVGVKSMIPIALKHLKLDA